MKAKLNRVSAIALATCLAIGSAVPVMAAETASTIRGSITGPNGEAVTDAKLTIIHGPTGTVTELTVNDEGNFTARGLRVGGPYTIVVDSDEFQDDLAENIFLNLGETLRFNRQLSDVQAVERITVVGSSTQYYALNGGSNSEFSRQDIDNAPGLNRDLKDVVRQNPMAVIGNDGISLSVAGINPRFNSFVVDGVSQNDDFGLNSNGYPTQRSPISIDAVESVALNTSPYSVKYGGFSGAQINAVTKSGTNEVKGSLFYEFTGDQLAGKGVSQDEERKDIEQDFKETTWGGTIGFPLVKDKLFFFGSYENFDSPQRTIWGPAGAGFPNSTSFTVDQYNEVLGIAKDVYGLDNIGVFDGRAQEKDQKILAKIDWNITDDHRAAFTYQNTKGNVTNATTERSNSLRLSSYWYDKEEILNSYSLNFYSDWTTDFTTELKIAYKDTKSNRNPVTNTGLGQVEISRDALGDPADTNNLTFGTERSSHSNVLSNNTLEIRFVGDYLIGDHELGFGFQYNDVEVFNLFMQDSLGTWEFNTIDDFRNKTVGRFGYQNTESGNPNDAAAKFNLKTLALFAEDKWLLTDDFELTFGLRYERFSMSDSPSFNQNFFDRYGFANNATFDGKDLILPRVGFTWYLTDEFTLKGGVGRFSGGYPNVWMSNSFSNDGIRVLRMDNPAFPDTNWDPNWNLDFANVPPEAQALLVGGDGNVNALDPNFKMPSDLRASLGFDWTVDIPVLGDEWYVGGEYLHIQKENDVTWVDLARRPVDVNFAGRVIYETYDGKLPEGMDSPTNRYDLLLTNAEQDGKSQTLTFTLAKSWDNGIRFRTSYAWNKVTEGNQGSSSTATSNFQFPLTQFDRNGTTLGPGVYEVPHRFVTTLGYDTEFFDGYKTGFNLFFEAKAGHPLSWVLSSFRDGDHGDQASFNSSNAYLPYIPTGPDDPNVSYSGGLTYEDFKQTLDSLGLSKYAGQIIPKGTSQQPWTRQLDFRFTQELPGFMDDHKGVVYFDIKNVLNLLNKDWGWVRYERFASKTLVDHTYDPNGGPNGDGMYTYSPAFGRPANEFNNWSTYDIRRSTWQMKVGIRYVF
ncbi:Oar protein [Paraferrimonas sedimenticola]|uniref:Oar protein n=2 Tax=Paraferrimonas sedimenticola TaxID=375674 RepID=A0AA37VT01_9GAMM|nr:Oar protein [Paraferrimonas sedimenticola]